MCITLTTEKLKQERISANTLICSNVKTVTSCSSHTHAKDRLNFHQISQLLYCKFCAIWRVISHPPPCLSWFLNNWFSTVPERAKPWRVEPAVTLENRINESNMYCMFEPGHQGKRAREREKLLWVVSWLTHSVEMTHDYQQQFIKKWSIQKTQGIPMFQKAALRKTSRGHSLVFFQRWII